MMHFNKQQEINKQVPTLLCSVCTVMGVLAIIVMNFNFFLLKCKSFCFHDAESGYIFTGIRE